VAYYEVIKRSLQNISSSWSLWSLMDCILLARAQNLRKVCKSSLCSKESPNLILCYFSLGTVAHFEPEHENKHLYVCGDGDLGSSCKPPPPIRRLSSNEAEVMQQTFFPSPRNRGLWITESENSLGWKAIMLDTNSNICLRLMLKGKVIHEM